MWLVSSHSDSRSDSRGAVLPVYRMGFEPSIALIGYGERWRTYRRISHQVMSVTAVQMYNDMLAKEAMRLVRSLAQDPRSYKEQMRLWVKAYYQHFYNEFGC